MPISRIMKGTFAGLVVLLNACVPPPEAPEDLDTLPKFLFSEWANEDAAFVQEGLKELYKQMSVVDLEGSLNDRKWAHTAIDEEFVVDVDRPDHDPAKTVGVSVVGASVWSVRTHARVQSDPERAPALEDLEPSAVTYVRELPSESSCLLTGECDRIATRNEIVRNQGIERTLIDLNKDFMLTTFTDEDGVEREALFARSWQSRESRPPKSSPDDPFTTGILQTFSVDIWMEADEGSIRFQTTWSEATVSRGLSDDLVRAVVAGGIDGVYRTTDKVLGEWYPDAD